MAAVDERLNGERRLHRGIRSEAVWSDVLDAERRMHLFDLLRLASSHRPRALAAFDAALDILAAGRGKKVVDLEPQVVDAATAVDHALRASAELTSVHVMATSPNGPGGTAYTLDEARELRLKARELKEAADEADMAARRAEIQCVPAGLRDGGGR